MESFDINEDNWEIFFASSSFRAIAFSMAELKRASCSGFFRTTSSLPPFRSSMNGWDLNPEN